MPQNEPTPMLSLGPVEEAKVYGALRASGESLRKIAARFDGVSHMRVRRRLEILKLPPEQQELVATGELSLRAACRECEYKPPPKASVIEALAALDDVIPTTQAGWSQLAQRCPPHELERLAEVREVVDAALNELTDEW